MRPGAGTRMAAVIGRPVGHSLSPLIHNAWLEAAGIDAVYLALAPSDDAAFWTLMDALRINGALGVNVTAPFKGAALTWAELNDADLTPAALAAVSVNLLGLSRDRPLAASTDGEGLIQAIRDQAPDLDLAGGPAVVLGAGGAGRAAVEALKAEGVDDIRVVNRSVERADDLARVSGQGVSAWALADAPDALDGSHLLINAISMPVALDLSPMAACAAVMDMTYRPLKTDLLVTAEARGLVPVDGLAMLIGQARPSFEVLFGRVAPAVDVRSLCLAALEVGR